jgi:hypothetical protein
MNPKTLLRNALLLLAAGGVVFVLGQEWAGRRGAPAVFEDTPIPETARVVVYFFSTGKECTTCEQIPQYTKATLERNFAPALASGALVYRAIDVDLPQHEHYLNEYKIYTKSVVVELRDRGKLVRWENLEKVWDLVYDEAGFEAYVRDAVRAMLEPAA